MLCVFNVLENLVHFTQSKNNVFHMKITYFVVFFNQNIYYVVDFTSDLALTCDQYLRFATLPVAVSNQVIV